ncbi:MAG: acyltransferase family protein, partial [Prevotellaceae bacterium]|nr:acyltransferase family protein [Candidatus Minthosoma caballi]
CSLNKKNHVMNLVTNKERIFWIDYAKGIAITLMIFGHIPIAEEVWNNYVYSFHMPVFFFLSGIFANNIKMNFREFILKNTYQLLIPYAILYIITIPVGLFTISIHPELFGYPTLIDKLWKPLIGLLSGEYLNHTSISLFTNGALWFLIALFWVRLFAYLMRKLKKWIQLLVSLCVSCLVVWVTRECFSVNLFWSIDSAFFALPFYIVGNIFVNSVFWEKISSWSTLTKLIISFLLFFVLWYSSLYNGPISVCGVKSGQCIILAYMNGCCGSVALSLLCLGLPSKLNLANTGKMSMLILAFHGAILYLIRFVALKTIGVPLDDYNVWIAILLSILVVCLLTPISLFIAKHFPILVGKAKK